MRKVAIAAVLSLVAAGGALATALYQLDRYLAAHQSELAARASAALGRTVGYAGASVSLRHGLGVTIEDLRVADDPAFADGDFVSAERAYATIAVLPALVGRIDVRRVRLERPRIAIIRSDAGFNLDSLLRRASPAALHDGTPARIGDAAATSGVQTRGLPLMPEVAIRDGSVSFVDRRRTPPAAVGLDRIDLAARTFGPDAALRFSLRAAAFAAATPNVRVHGTWPSDDQQPLAIEARMDGLILDDLAQLPSVADALPSHLSSPDPVRISLRLEGTRAQPQFNLEFDATGAAVRYGTLVEKPAGSTLTVRGNGQLRIAPPSMDLRALRVDLAGMEATLAGSVLAGSPPSVDLTLAMPEAAIAALEPVFPELADRHLGGTAAAALRVAGVLRRGEPPSITGTLTLANVSAGSADLPGRISGLSTTVRFSGDRALLPPTDVTIGEQHATVACQATRVPAPTAACTLAADALVPGAFAAAATRDDIVRDLRVTVVVPPGYLDDGLVHAEVISSAGVLHGIAYSDLDATAALGLHEYRLEHAAASVCGGALTASGSYRIDADRLPRFALQASARGVQLASVLSGRKRATDVDGRVTADLSVTAAGATWPEVRDAARGEGHLLVRDGTFGRANLADTVLGGLPGIISKRARQRHPELFGEEDLRFEKLNGSLRIQDGLVRSDDLRLQAPDVDVEARGSAALQGGTLDGRGTLALSPALTADLLGGGIAARDVSSIASGLDIPFTVGGTVAKPRIRPTAGAVVDTLGRGLGALLDNPGGREADQLLRKGLDRLFRR